ncbi:hypothetical protein BDN70DRAFT_888727 [Pholiota conissans]|uniref:Uncharacterized protein n=1 Tax=Pholiota conissans TaxID=109636 RepID=A0A9P5YN30_9AGAR|nr:hypothetical protein BDN70DRAFT_888727 [Pholiota conissans]
MAHEALQYLQCCIALGLSPPIHAPRSPVSFTPDFGHAPFQLLGTILSHVFIGWRPVISTNTVLRQNNPVKYVVLKIVQRYTWTCEIRTPPKYLLSTSFGSRLLPGIVHALPSHINSTGPRRFYPSLTVLHHVHFLRHDDNMGARAHTYVGRCMSNQRIGSISHFPIVGSAPIGYRPTFPRRFLKRVAPRD